MNPSSRIEKTPQLIANAATPSRSLFNLWISQDQKGTKDLDIKLLQHLHDEITKDGDEMYAKDDHEL